MKGLTRSFWAWGFEERFPDVAARAKLAERVGFLLGSTELAARTPAPAPTLAEARVPPPRVGIPQPLAGFSSASSEARVRHTYGRAFPDLVRGFRGDFSAAPDFVLEPATEADVELSLRVCEAEGIACVPYGGGTSVVGGVEARAARRATLSLCRMSGLLELDPVSRSARFGAGTTGPDLEAALRPHGLTLRHYPQSYELSTLGGWIATRAGGHFSTLYTHIDHHTEAVRMVTPRGVIATRRVAASGAGPSPLSLVLGSEGVLGVITEAWVRVRELPRWRARATVRFPSFADGAEGVRAIAQAHLHPATCRLLDPVECLFASIPTDGKSSVLLLGFESADRPPEAELERAIDLAEHAGGRCDHEPDTHADAGALGSYRQGFFDGPYLQSALVTLGVFADTFETSCTWSSFAALDARLRAAFAKELTARGLAGVLACRFTHVYDGGPAPYYTMVVDPRGADLIEVWHALKERMSGELHEAGATITHHHAVGRTHRPWYEREAGEALVSALRGAKSALDPAGIMNPGALLPEG